MPEFRCIWIECPHIHHTRKVAFVEAEDRDSAMRILRDHIERTKGIEWFTILEVNKYERPTGGRVISDG